MVFSADDGASGIELLRCDGTAADTRRIADIHPGQKGDDTTPPADSFPNNFCVLRGTLFFSANDGYGYELWSSDGTTAGTRRIADINRVRTPNRRRSGSSFPDGFVARGPNILFRADDGIHGEELWRTDGTAAGTALLADIRAGDERSNSIPISLTALGHRNVCFSAFDDSSGRELWKSDGTTAGTERVADIRPGSTSTIRFFSLIGFGDVLLFFANDGITGNQLWRTDGTADGTVALAKVPYPENITFARDTLLFSRSKRLWRSDGTASGTAPIGRLNPARKGKQFPPNYREAIGSTVYFDGWQERSGKELWSLDLSAALRGDGSSGGMAGLL